MQTAFIGDALLATAAAESLKAAHPGAQLHFLVREGNQSIVNHCPAVDQVWVWQKKSEKYKSLRRLIRAFRQEQFDVAFNLQRFFTSGLLLSLSGARIKVGFQQNPLSWAFDLRAPHRFGGGTHEVERNLDLLRQWDKSIPYKLPKIEPNAQQDETVRAYQDVDYLTIAPASVWHTKQFPAERYGKFIQGIREDLRIYLIGAPEDAGLAEEIRRRTSGQDVVNLCGQLHLMESAALMAGARMNYANDSAPVHLASAVQAPVCAIFCSTLPDFGFTPLSEDAYIVEREGDLYCRPCGSHGKKACPEGHFRCAGEIDLSRLHEAYQKKP